MPEKFEKKKFVFNFRPLLLETLSSGEKKPININNFAGLSRKWVGVKLFMYFFSVLGIKGNTEFTINPWVRTNFVAFPLERIRKEPRSSVRF